MDSCCSAQMQVEALNQEKQVLYATQHCLIEQITDLRCERYWLKEQITSLNHNIGIEQTKSISKDNEIEELVTLSDKTVQELNTEIVTRDQKIREQQTSIANGLTEIVGLVDAVDKAHADIRKLNQQYENKYKQLHHEIRIQRLRPTINVQPIEMPPNEETDDEF